MKPDATVETELVDKTDKKVELKKPSHIVRNIFLIASSGLTVIILLILGLVVWTRQVDSFGGNQPPVISPAAKTTPVVQSNITTQKLSMLTYNNLTATVELQYPSDLGVVAKIEKNGQYDKLTLDYNGSLFSLEPATEQDLAYNDVNFKTTDYKEIWTETFRVKEKTEGGQDFYFYGNRSYYPSDCENTTKYCFVRHFYWNSTYKASLKVPTTENSAEILKFFDNLLLNAAQVDSVELTYKGNSAAMKDDYYTANDGNEYYYFTQKVEAEGMSAEEQGMYDTGYLINPNILTDEQKVKLSNGNVGKKFQVVARCEYVAEGMPGIKKCFEIRTLELAN